MAKEIIPIPHNFDPEDGTLLLEADNTRDITSYLPPFLLTRVQSLPAYVWDMSFSQLYRKASLSVDANVLLDLRRQFWEQYEVARAANAKINAREVAYSVCSFEYFRQAILCHEALAYILSPVPPAESSQKALLSLGFERMFEIMSVSPKFRDPKTNDETINDKLAKVQYNITEMLMNRIHGMPVERQQTMNVNVNANASDNTQQKANLAAITSMEELQKRLAELKEREAKRLAPVSQPLEPDLKKLVRPDIVE